MLQPKNYPRFIGQALLLEPDPFVEMVDDDNPWIEGLFLCACIGVLGAVAKLVGGLLLTASLPPSEAILSILFHTLRQSALNGETVLEIERAVRNVWPFFLVTSGYDSGWFRLVTLATAPLCLIAQWFFFGFVGHLLARAVGGRGALGQTLGAMALSNAPRLLALFSIIPFVSVASLLIHVWGVLIAYRGLEVAHELSPGPAALVAIGTWLLLLLVSIILGSGLGALLMFVGGVL